MGTGMLLKAARNFLRLVRDVRGVSATTVAIAAVPLVGGIGVSADVGRIYIVKSKLQDAVESSAFAASRVLQQSGDRMSAIDMAAKVFRLAEPDGANSIITLVDFDPVSHAVTIRASATVPTGLVGRFTPAVRSMQIDATAKLSAPNLRDISIVRDN